MAARRGDGERPPARSPRQQETRSPPLKKALLHPDTQNTAVCEHLAMDALLQEKLRAAGYEKDALVLKLIGEGFAAFEHCGSTTEERMQKLSARRDLLVSLYGHRIYHLYMAEQSHVAGLPKGLLRAWVFNADAHQALVERHPALSDLPLCEQALGSNACEVVFGILHQHQGYEQPTVETRRSMQTVLRKQNMVTDGNCPISMEANSKSRYPVRKRQQRPTEWISPVDDSKTQKQLRQASTTATRKRHNAPRESNKAKVLAGQGMGN